MELTVKLGALVGEFFFSIKLKSGDIVSETLLSHAEEISKEAYLSFPETKILDCHRWWSIQVDDRNRCIISQDYTDIKIPYNVFWPLFSKCINDAITDGMIKTQAFLDHQNR